MCGKSIQCVVWKKHAHNAERQNLSTTSARTSDKGSAGDLSARLANTNDHHIYTSHLGQGSNKASGTTTSKMSLPLKMLQRWAGNATSAKNTLLMVQAYIDLTTQKTTQSKTVSWFTRFAMRFTESTTRNLESRVTSFVG